MVPTEVQIAARRGDVARVKHWIETEGGNVNDEVNVEDADADFYSDLQRDMHVDDRTLLSDICFYPASSSVIPLLLERGATIQHDVYLCVAVLRGCAENVRALLLGGADPNCDGGAGSVLHTAASSPFHEMVALLLDHGADVNQVSPGNACLTPLMLAAYSCKSLEIVRLLLSRGADINARTQPVLPAAPFGYSVMACPRRALEETRLLQELPEDYDFGDCFLETDGPSRDFRLPGEVESVRELLVAVRDAGSWTRYSNAPRKDLIVLQALCASGRASPPAGVFAALYALPLPLVWTVLEFWRSSRDPGSPEPNPRLVYND